MKKIFFSVICACALITIGMTYSSYQTLGKYNFLLLENIEALTTEEGTPGPWNPNWVNNPGKGTGDDRRGIAVMCGPGGWSVVPGCCLGQHDCGQNDCTASQIKGC